LLDVFRKRRHGGPTIAERSWRGHLDGN
jgi:hypothetical protein